MKKTVIAFASGLAVSGLLAFTAVATYEAKNSTAEVDQVMGYYIFVDSKPVKEYDYLGTVKKSMTWGSGQYQDVRDGLLKKARKEYPDANGIIFHFHDGGTDRVDAIKFKE